MERTFITPEDVLLKVDEIAEVADSGDDEAAHGREKKLWRLVLKEIAEGAPLPQQLAEEALKTKDVRFSRWYA